MEHYDYEYAQEVGRRIARMTPEELKAYSERIAAKTLRERLADPHGYNKPLFPKAIADMSHEERQAESLECAKALRINVWQTTSQAEEVQIRHVALFNSFHEHIMSDLPEQQSKEQAQ